MRRIGFPNRSTTLLPLLEIVRASLEQQANNEAEQPKHRREDLNDQDLHEAAHLRSASSILSTSHSLLNLQRRIRSISQSRTRPVDPHTNTTHQVAHADQQSRPEQRKACVVVAAAVERIAGDGLNLRGKHDGHDDAVDGDDFAEDDGDEVLGADARGFDAAAQD